jgi:hypothetical protein
MIAYERFAHVYQAVRPDTTMTRRGIARDLEGSIPCRL